MPSKKKGDNPEHQRKLEKKRFEQRQHKNFENCDDGNNRTLDEFEIYNNVN